MSGLDQAVGGYLAMALWIRPSGSDWAPCPCPSITPDFEKARRVEKAEMPVAKALFDATRVLSPDLNVSFPVEYTEPQVRPSRSFLSRFPITGDSTQQSIP
jgi:hypothetical protein